MRFALVLLALLGYAEAHSQECQPRAEYDETELKLGALLPVLAG